MPKPNSQQTSAWENKSKAMASIAEALEATIPERDMETHCEDVIRALGENGLVIVPEKASEKMLITAEHAFRDMQTWIVSPDTKGVASHLYTKMIGIFK